MPHEINAILAEPQAYGFEFGTETVRVGGRGDKGTPFDVPILTITDLGKFEEAFPGVALDALNGQSVRVSSQRIGRDGAEKGTKPDEIRAHNVRWLLGIKTTSPRNVYVGPEGRTFGTQEEAEAAWMEHFTK